MLLRVYPLLIDVSLFTMRSLDSKSLSTDATQEPPHAGSAAVASNCCGVRKRGVSEKKWVPFGDVEIFSGDQVVTKCDHLPLSNIKESYRIQKIRQESP